MSNHSPTFFRCQATEIFSNNVSLYRENNLFSKSKEFHLEVTEEDVISGNNSATDLLANISELSRQKVKQAMQKGAVWLTDNKGTRRLRRQNKKLLAGTSLHFYFDSEILNTQASPAILVADESTYSVWYKPAGMFSQGSKWGDHCAINRWSEQYLEPQRPAFIVHRLDRFASGLILIAHSKKMATLLSELFQKKQISKRYKVIVRGHFPQQRITFDTKIDNKTAITHASLIEYDESKDHSLLLVDIETGRKHQIRIHLSLAGYPVIGDRLYGNDDYSDLKLTAFRLSFICPQTQTEKTFTLADELQPKL